MIAYKGFEKNLSCRGYQFKRYGINETTEANCRQNGFHDRITDFRIFEVTKNGVIAIQYYHRVNKKISGQIQKILQGFLLDQHQMKVFVPDIKIMKDLQNPIEHKRKRLIGI